MMVDASCIENYQNETTFQSGCRSRDTRHAIRSCDTVHAGAARPSLIGANLRIARARHLYCRPYERRPRQVRHPHVNTTSVQRQRGFPAAAVYRPGRQRLAYILSASHSGSTLLAMLLGSHREACTAGELKFSPSAMGEVNSYRCSCHAPIGECEYWRAVQAGMARRGLLFQLGRAGTDYRQAPTRLTRRLAGFLHRGPLLEALRDAALLASPAWRRSLAQTHRRNAALVDTLAELNDSRVVIDSSKVPLRLKYLLRNPELDVKVIRLIRDGRGVALTYMDQHRFADAAEAHMVNGGRGQRSAAGDSQPRVSMTEAALRWRRANEECERLHATLGEGRCVQVRYEDFCQCGQAVLDRLLQFLDLEPANREQDFRQRNRHVVGNGMRFDTDSQLRLDERWREVLTAAELKEFDAAAGRMNRRYGYR